MAEITAAMVKELREKTDAPMMECKKALTEAGGDLEKAEEILRVKLGNKASKAASRVAAEGVVAIHISADQKLGAIVEVNCETDFVAKNDDFLALSVKLAEMVATQNPADVAALSALTIGGTSVEETRRALVGKIGENLSIRRFVRIAAKGALNAATRALSLEVASRGITVNAVAPGFIATDMTRAMPEHTLAAMAERTPVGRLGQPQDVANAYLFLASEEASFINGEVLGVDGGLVLGT